MTQTVVSRWLNKLPENEKNLPLLIVDSSIYTPRTAYNEVMRSSELGNKLQALIESGRFGTTAYEEEQVAKIRLRAWLQTQPEIVMFHTLSGKSFTPSQLLQEIESNTTIGQQWIRNEQQHMRLLVSAR
jgi:hypothetical protein